MINEEKIYNQFESGEITITLDEETAQKAREIFKVENSRAEYEFIKSALKKQIPTKQKEQMKYCGKCECGHCIFADMNYCPNCGQKLDWSGEVKKYDL